MMIVTPPSGRDGFQLAIICAIPTEYDAVCLVFDEVWGQHGDLYGRAPGDNNTYKTGRIGNHNVVLALLPSMGKVNAAAAAATFRSSYSSLELALLVGICGGVPRTGNNADEEILLGDVVISKAVIQYDFGRRYPGSFIRKDTFKDNLSKPSKKIRGLLATFETEDGLGQLQERTACFLKQLQAEAIKKKRRARYGYPGASQDTLFEPGYHHKHRTQRCSTCDGNSGTDAVCKVAFDETCEMLGCHYQHLVVRGRLEEKQQAATVDEAQEPMIHIGAVASGDTVMNSGEDRDRIATKEGVIAFEMEGAGVWEEVPCIVVKGVCNYADSHKNKKWQNFAAATAASAAKALI